MAKMILKNRYQLKEAAKMPSEMTTLLQNLNRLDFGDQEIETGKRLFLGLLDASKGHETTPEEHSPEHIRTGLDNMYLILKENLAYTSAPVDELEREAFYSKLAKGFAYLAQFIEKEFGQGKMDKQDVYACLDTIGDGGHACAGRWRQVLEELMRGFSHLMNERKLQESLKQDPLTEEIRALFYTACGIEGNRSAEDFLSLYYPGVGTESRLHFTTFFKRTLNEVHGFHLAATMEEDSYLRNQREDIIQRIQDFLSARQLEHRIIQRFIVLFQGKIHQDGALYDALLNYSKNLYEKLPKGSREEDVVTFLSERIFREESKELRKEAILEMLQNKGFIETGTIEISVAEQTRQLILQQRWHKLESFLIEMAKVGALDDEVRNELGRSLVNGETVLSVCSREGRTALLKLLIENGADINRQSGDAGWTALMWAIKNRHEEAAKMLLEAGADTNLGDTYDNLPLVISAGTGQMDLMRYLLVRGADVNGQSHYGWTALMAATTRSNVEMADLLIERGANLNHQDVEGCTALLYAARFGCIDLVNLFLEKGADCDKQDVDGLTALMLASRHGDLDVVKALLEAGANGNRQNKAGETALILAISNGHVETAKALMHHGVDVNKQDSNKETALMKAVMLGSEELIRDICEKGANINLRDRFGSSALTIGVEMQRLPISQYLLDRGADINQRDAYGRTALIVAATNGRLASVKMLLKRGIDINSRDHDGLSALMWTAKYGHVETAKALMDAGADPNHSTRNGNTALIFAANNGYAQMVKEICGRGADLNLQNGSGFTALMQAVRNGHIDTVKALLEGGADITIRGRFGQDALKIAMNRGRTNIVHLLAERRREILAGRFASESGRELDRLM